MTRYRQWNLGFGFVCKRGQQVTRGRWKTNCKRYLAIMDRLLDSRVWMQSTLLVSTFWIFFFRGESSLSFLLGEEFPIDIVLFLLWKFRVSRLHFKFRFLWIDNNLIVVASHGFNFQKARGYFTSWRFDFYAGCKVLLIAQVERRPVKFHLVKGGKFIIGNRSSGLPHLHSLRIFQLTVSC